MEFSSSFFLLYYFITYNKYIIRLNSTIIVFPWNVGVQYNVAGYIKNITEISFKTVITYLGTTWSVRLEIYFSLVGFDMPIPRARFRRHNCVEYDYRSDALLFLGLQISLQVVSIVAIFL